MISDRKSQPRQSCLVDEAYEKILRCLSLGDLQPGSRVTEADLSERFKMGRTPVREAINRVVSTGLLERAPHRGATVPVLGEQDILEVLRVREAIERQAARFAASRITDSDLAQLYAMCDEMDAFFARNTPEGIYHARQLDIAFHLRLVQLSCIRKLYEHYAYSHLLLLNIFGPHWTHNPQYAMQLGGVPLGKVHRPIVDALATRDPRKAEAAIEASVEQTISDYQRMFDKHRMESVRTAPGSAMFVNAGEKVEIR